MEADMEHNPLLKTLTSILGKKNSNQIDPELMDFLADQDDFTDQEDYTDYDYAPEPIKRGPKIGRNDPCPCGTGKKYKKCCLNKK
ncbi:MAG: SEC-C metal-binding domain-containing protein [Bacteroidota bacterium]